MTSATRDRILARTGDAPMLGDLHARVCANAFNENVSAFSHVLLEAGLGAGEVLACMLPNRIDIVTSRLAAWRIGAIFMPINPAFTASEAEFQLSDSAAKIVIVDETNLSLAQGPRQILVRDFAYFAPKSVGLEPERVSPVAIALLIYTSGSTGRPKGVMLSHANIDVMVVSITAALKLSDADRSFLVLPLFHVNALLVSVLAPLAVGGSVIVSERFDRKTFWQDLVAHDATYFSGVPAMYILLTGDACEEPSTHGLRFAICGAAPMPAAAIAAFEEAYGVRLLEGYGLTESTVGATLTPLEGERRAGSVGRAMSGVAIRIIDDEGAQVPPGTPGEVALSGPTIMMGYLGQEVASAEAVVNGWLKTGDIGQLDAAGRLTLIDRKKDIIIRGGENLNPAEIEEVLVSLDAVREAAVVGRADPVMGEVPIAFVALRARARRESLISELAEHLASCKIPVAFHVLEALPRNPIGKIDKPSLRAMNTAQLEEIL